MTRTAVLLIFLLGAVLPPRPPVRSPRRPRRARTTLNGEGGHLRFYARAGFVTVRTDLELVRGGPSQWTMELLAR